MPRNPDQKVDQLDPAPMMTEDPQAKASTSERKTVEAWAMAKGMLPEFIAPAPAAISQLPVGSRSNPKYSLFAGARAGSGWPEGAELTEAEFDAAVEKFGPQNVMR